jgi:hypothetical protein
MESDLLLSRYDRGHCLRYTKYDLNEYNHSLLKLGEYLSGNEESMTEVDARIYHFYARERHSHFEKIAEEIDNSYKEP